MQIYSLHIYIQYPAQPHIAYAYAYTASMYVYIIHMQLYIENYLTTQTNTHK